MDWLIVGLGNPGVKYINTRHNIGFRVVECCADRWNLGFKLEARWKAHMAKGSYKNLSVALVKPTTFMNLSGESVAPLAHFYQIPADNILVILDDVALPFGRLRIRGKGSSGGHNGVKSLIQHLGNNQDFPRLRVGIGDPSRDMIDHVLSAFSPAESQILNDILPVCVDAIDSLLVNGVTDTMNRFNGWELPVENPRSE